MNWNDILKQNFIELIGVIKDGANGLSKELPLYIKDLITYEIYTSIVYMSISLCIILLTLVLLYKFYRYINLPEKETSENGFMIYTMSSVVMGVASIICMLALVFNLNTVIKCKYAPRVYVVEKIQHMVRDLTRPEYR